jgi:hypothetical protein
MKRYVQILNLTTNCIGGVMASMLASSAVDRGFELRSGQTKDYEIDICCLLIGFSIFEPGIFQLCGLSNGNRN